ncbi:MAG: amylosucrase [Pleomorphochaeta sp.]
MLYQERKNKYRTEIYELLYSLYGRTDLYSDLEKIIDNRYKERDLSLKELDLQREKTPNWYIDKNMLGITMYADLFAGSLLNIINKIPYLKEIGITYLHLMPILKMPKNNNDGGYAVDSLHDIDPKFGSNEDLAKLSKELRENDISLCLDFVLNHTSSTHPWAIKAKNGDQEAKERYVFYNDRKIPDYYDSIVPDVFPSSAPGNFTYVEDLNEWVLTSFYPFQWDLNYKNPKVLFDVIDSMLILANLGNEIFRLDAVPYIWKKLGTKCRNLEEVHKIVRLIHIVMDIVCPSIILKGEVVMAPNELAAYFGTKEKPECHLLYNAAIMANLWDSLASQDTRLLVEQLNSILSLPSHCHFVNYIRCHDDIGWALDMNSQYKIGQDPIEHKKFVYNFFSGNFPFSYSKGELYNYDPITQDARSCGTAASFCGIEKALNNDNIDEMNKAINRDLLMHAIMFSIEGFPLLSSGDEIGQLNDYSYKDNILKVEDQRNLHRSNFDWEKAKLRNIEGSYQQRLFDGIKQLGELKKSNNCFSNGATVTTWDSHNDKVLIIRRTFENEELLCIFSYSDEIEQFYTNNLVGDYIDLFTNERLTPGWGYSINSHQYIWAKKIK